MNKRVKKGLSFTLSLLIALSCFSTGLVAFAAEAAEKNAEEVVTELTTELANELTTNLVPESKPENESKPAEDATPNTDKSREEAKKYLDNAFNDISKAFADVVDSGFQILDELPKNAAAAAPRNAEALDKFLKAMDTVTEPYDNNDIDLVKPLYEALSIIDRGKLSKEVKAKYQAILASIGPNIPGTDLPDLSVYHKTVVTYPNRVSRDKVERALPKLEGFVNSTLLMVNQNQDLSTVIGSKLYTNEMVVKLCQALYPKLGELTILLKISPSKLAKSLTEEKYAGAVTALKNAGQDWNALTVANGDFGFQDGDKEGFMDAVSALFRPLSAITLLLTFENTVNTSKGTYTYGAYEDLIPVFEMLDAQGVLSSHEYTLQVQEAAKISANAAMDARIRPILVPVFNLVDTFAKNPVNTLLTVLPKLGYLLDTDLLSTQIGKLLSKIKLVSIPAPDLSAKAIFGMISPSLKEIDANGIKLSFLQDEATFVNFVKEIGGCGTAVSKKSIAFENLYRLGIDPDTCDAFVVLFRLLYNEIASPTNIQSLRDAVANNEALSSVERFAAEQILNQLERTSADKAMATFLNILAPNPPKFTLLGMVQDIIKKLFGSLDALTPDFTDIFDSIFGGSSDKGDGDPITTNPDIPKTGVRQAGALLAFAVVAAVAAGAVVYKKSKEE